MQIATNINFYHACKKLLPILFSVGKMTFYCQKIKYFILMKEKELIFNMNTLYFPNFTFQEEE